MHWIYWVLMEVFIIKQAGIGKLQPMLSVGNTSCSSFTQQSVQIHLEWKKNQQTNWHLWELSTHIVIKFIELRRLNVCSMFRLWGWQPLIDNESEWQQWWMGGGAMDHGVGGGCWQCHWRLHHCDCLTLTPVTRSQWKPAQKAVVLSLPVVMRDIAFTRVTLGKWSGQIIFISIDCSFKKETVFSFSGHDENIEIQLAMNMELFFLSRGFSICV